MIYKPPTKPPTNTKDRTYNRHTLRLTAPWQKI